MSQGFEKEARVKGEKPTMNHQIFIYIYLNPMYTYIYIYIYFAISIGRLRAKRHLLVGFDAFRKLFQRPLPRDLAKK